MRGDVTDRLIETDVWTDELVARAGIPVIDVPLVTVGGGLGSFALFDTLRIFGVPGNSIAVLAPQESPWESYRYLAGVSQISDRDRLRGDAGGTLDNLWGFPSYALREAIADKSLEPLWKVLAEPVFADFYAPRSGRVIAGLERECRRVGFGRSVHRGRVRMVRKRTGGGYFTMLTPSNGAGPSRRIAFRSTHAHLAVGFPGLRLLPDLQGYRERYRDSTRAVSAYEPHEHVYEALRHRPGTVMVRGSGAVAGRVLQRLVDDRDRLRLSTQILHLFGDYVTGPKGRGALMRRPGGDGWAYQGFDWPKAAWGGQLAQRMRGLDGRERVELLNAMGGTTAPARRERREQLRRGRTQGWYQVIVGIARDPRPARTRPGLLVTVDPDPHAALPFPQPDRPYDAHADYIIDCTGAEADIREHRLLADLLDHGGALRNPLGRLEVDRTFEVHGTRSAPGRLYVSGSAAFGGYYAPVNSFLGLQYAALQIADDLAAQGFCRRLGPLRSLRQWWLWVTDRKIAA
ncbi:hypothetical protein ACWDOP_06440 [Nocardia sp. NPDC003693]